MSAQRTAVNSEAKLLLLTHAFERLRCIRVEFVTDVLNQQSRTAIWRLGAKQEGVLRNHMLCRAGVTVIQSASASSKRIGPT